jgi:alpha-beta hydrolase superfamily lysophospholipase
MNGEDLQILMVEAETGAALPIAYRFEKPQAGKPAFVWFCGFRSEMGSVKASALAGWAKANGAGCLRFDYSGHGKSGGRFEDGTIGAWLAQAAAVCAHVLRDTPAVFVGSSMGGWIALLLARQILRVPPHPVLLPEGRRDARNLAEGSSGVLSPIRIRLRMRKLRNASSPRRACGERDRVRGDSPFNLKGITLIAPAWDMTRLFWERATPEIRDTILRDGVYLRPSDYDGGPTPITRALFEDGERHFLGASPLQLPVPIRILHGCQDPDIPWRHSLALLETAGCPDMRLTLVKDAVHRLSRPQDLALLFSTLAEFL